VISLYDVTEQIKVQTNPSRRVFYYYLILHVSIMIIIMEIRLIHTAVYGF